MGRVSVIVPVYNTEKYLEQCISSILNQTYGDIEIILVDDGSTDNSGNICECFRNMDAKVLCIHTQNNGLVSARKAGIELSSGEYIIFVDADDYIERNFVEELVFHIVSSNADFAHSGYIMHEEGENFKVECQEGVFNIQTYENKRMFFQEYILGIGKIGITASIWSKIFQKDFIRECYREVPDEQQYGEDIICLMSCIEKAKRVELINMSLYNYRVRENSLSHINKENYLRKEISLLNSLGNFFENCQMRLYLNVELYDFLIKRTSNILKHVAISSFYVPCFYFRNIRRLYHKKIIIYGAGNVGKDYYRQFSAYNVIEVVLWVDKNYQLYNLDYCDIAPVDSILSNYFHYIVIAVLNLKVANEIKDELTLKGIDEDRLIWDLPQKYI